MSISASPYRMGVGKCVERHLMVAVEARIVARMQKMGRDNERERQAG